MRQETGSSSHPTIELSIQLRLDGDSFYLEGKGDSIDSGSDCRPIHLLSHRSMLAPLCEVERCGATAVLQSAGIALDSGDSVISIERDQNVVLIALDKGRAQLLDSAFGEDAPYTSPLLRSPLNEKQHIIIYTAQGLTYINIYSVEKMIFAEVFLTPALSDTLYWLSRINDSIPLADYAIYVANNDAPTAKYLSKYLSNVTICE